MVETMPARSRIRFPGISSRAYEHPADRSALTALRKLTGFDAVFRKLASLISEPSFRLTFLANGVRTSDEQFHDLYEILRDAAYILDLPELPEMYVVSDPRPNAMAVGLDTPLIVLTTGLIDLMDHEELRVVVGHELGHVLSGHAVYRTMLISLVNLAAAISWVPVGGLVLKGLIAGLEEWFRKSELSCDRAGLLVGQDPDAAVRVLMKLAGGSHVHEMSAAAFLAQGEEYDKGGDLRDSVLKLLSLQGQTHPFAAVRALRLRRWSESDEYARILAGTYPRRGEETSASFTDEVKAAASSYKDTMKQSGDPLFGLLGDIAGGAADAGGKLLGRLRDLGERRGTGGGDDPDAPAHDEGGTAGGDA